MKAYVATVRRTDGGTLIGCVTRHGCYPMETAAMAETWAKMIGAENARCTPGESFSYSIRTVDVPNPIREAEILG